MSKRIDSMGPAPTPIAVLKARIAELEAAKNERDEIEKALVGMEVVANEEHAARLLAEAAAAEMRRALEMVRSYWTFDNYQQHTHNWHDWQACKVIYDKALSTDTGARLAEMVREVESRPCHGIETIAGECPEALPRAPNLWCDSCRMRARNA